MKDVEKAELQVICFYKLNYIVVALWHRQNDTSDAQTWRSAHNARLHPLCSAYSSTLCTRILPHFVDPYTSNRVTPSQLLAISLIIWRETSRGRLLSGSGDARRSADGWHLSFNYPTCTPFSDCFWTICNWFRQKLIDCPFTMSKPIADCSKANGKRCIGMQIKFHYQ